MALHPLAQQFADVAEVYDRGRPGYPAEAVAIAARAFELEPRARVADLGAGTGKLTARLVEAGLDVVAVEPLEAMAARITDVEVVTATAEQLPFADGSLAAVFSADAFHWFDAEATAAELHRVLRPRGGVALLWHLPGWESDPPAWWQRLRDLLDSLRAGHPGFVGEQGREAFAQHGGFEPFTYESVLSTFATDREGVLAYVQSISYVAAHPERDRVLDEVRTIIRDVEPHDSPVRTFVWLTRCN
ncbi:MAG TPA: class I SAM-dependent methyltransferase [Solirubrobacteraceae bacterium]|nr:class I SAM-dependent methyltransferase [Solirubrobacteraceae bacterium]